MSQSKLSKTAEMFDDYIFEILKKGGEIVRDAEGNIVMETDAKGKETPCREVTPALLGIIERRMHHGGMSLSGKESDSRGVGGAVEELRRQGKLKLVGGGKMPPVSTERDRITG